MLVYQKNMETSRFIIANITWNPDGWRNNNYSNPKAGHRGVRKSPSNESLNFDFNKEIDNEKHVFGYVQLRGYPQRFEEPGVIFFFTKNLDEHRNEIVGVYGNAEVVRPVKEEERSKSNSRTVEIKAEKERSILFPIYLSADPYSKKRLVPQSGLKYITEELATKIITDEIKAIEKTDNMIKNEYKLYSIFEMITGKTYAGYGNDTQEQLEIEKAGKEKPIDKIIAELENVSAKDAELIKINGKTYKRDNKTIADLKLLHDFKCQICRVKIPKKKKCDFYIEAAHIKAKNKAGPETPNNILILCPNHHKEFDYGDRVITEHSEKQIIFRMKKKKYTINLEPGKRYRSC